MEPKARFHPEKVAYYEMAGWEAYYDRDWLRVLRLMVQLNREEFGLSLLQALAASLDVVRASVAFKPVENDIPETTRHLRHYFERVRRVVGLRADAGLLAQLEINYWIVHRQLAIERQKATHAGSPDSTEDIRPMIEALEQLHAALFEAPPEATRRSAELRALAAKTVDRITGHYSVDEAEDWRKIESYLQEAYRSLITG
jgi:hypothetical protein